MQATQRVECGAIDASKVEVNKKSTDAEIVIWTGDSKAVVFSGNPSEIRKVLKSIENKLREHFGPARVE